MGVMTRRPGLTEAPRPPGNILVKIAVYMKEGSTNMRACAMQLDPTQRSVASQELEEGLRRKIVRQDEAVQAVVDLYQVFRAGLNSPGRPVGNLLFLGPTGA